MTGKPVHPNDGSICPLMRKACHKVCHTCKLYRHVRGRHPQTGEDIDHWDCTFGLLPTLQLESTQQMRQAGAAIESFRNEMVTANERAFSLSVLAAGRAIPIPGAPNGRLLDNPD